MKEELIFNSENHVVLINIKKLKNVFISKMKINLEQKCKKKIQMIYRSINLRAKFSSFKYKIYSSEKSEKKNLVKSSKLLQ